MEERREGGDEVSIWQGTACLGGAEAPLPPLGVSRRYPGPVPEPLRANHMAPIQSAPPPFSNATISGEHLSSNHHSATPLTRTNSTARISIKSGYLSALVPDGQGGNPTQWRSPSVTMKQANSVSRGASHCPPQHCARRWKVVVYGKWSDRWPSECHHVKQPRKIQTRSGDR